ncbi:hypothetical protein AGR1C_pAt40043 [Agrobacterium fabacearum TT111]|nr:hypothetical protein AGR1C_pAt40043 [Agrobacterium fabacearum TT111]
MTLQVKFCSVICLKEVASSARPPSRAKAARRSSVWPCLKRQRTVADVSFLAETSESSFVLGDPLSLRRVTGILLLMRGEPLTPTLQKQESNLTDRCAITNSSEVSS